MSRPPRSSPAAAAGRPDPRRRPARSSRNHREAARKGGRRLGRTLPPDGPFVFFVYLLALPFRSRTGFARALRERFRSVRHTETIRRKVPPAAVFAGRGRR